MIGEAKNVNDYLKQVPEKRNEALTGLRTLCKKLLIRYEGSIAYGESIYKKVTGIEIGFASQKNPICFYCLIYNVMLDNKKLLKGLNHGKRVIRYSNPDKIDFVLIRKILTDTFNSDKNAC